MVKVTGTNIWTSFNFIQQQIWNKNNGFDHMLDDKIDGEVWTEYFVHVLEISSQCPSICVGTFD